jgi:SSS family solute:Na+ symporter
LVPPVAVVFIMGLFWRRASATGAFATLLGGHLVSALLFSLSLLGLLSLHFTIIAGLSALASVLIFLFAGGLGRPPSDDQVSRFTFDAKATERQAALAWWQDYRLYAAILVVLTIALVITHW